MYTCRISGLNVSAEIELPGVAHAPVPLDSEDVRIRLRSLPEQLEETTARGPLWELNENEFLLCLPGVGRFLARDGRTLDMDSEPGTDPADAIPFLLGTGFGAVLLQRGVLVLHAAAVADDGRAYVFCGPSGIGKSTLAAALCRAGCDFVNDDVCAIERDQTGAPVLWPDGRRLKLFEESIAHLEMAARRRAPVRAGFGKYYVVPPGTEPNHAAAPLAAIYIVRDPAPAHPPGIERLSPLNAAQALLNESYRPTLALAMARRGRHVAVTAAILSRISVFRWTRTRSLDRLADTAAELRAHWRSLSG